MRSLALAVVLTAGLVLIGTATAEAATKTNWLRPCSSHVTTSCLVNPPDVDALHHRLVFHDKHGHTVTAKHRAKVWAFVKKHSHRCPTPNDFRCYRHDDIAGNSIVMPDGYSIALRYFHK